MLTAKGGWLEEQARDFKNEPCYPSCRVQAVARDGVFEVFY